MADKNIPLSIGIRLLKVVKSNKNTALFINIRLSKAIKSKWYYKGQYSWPKQPSIQVWFVLPQSAQWSSSIIDPRAGAVDQISQQYTDDFHCHIHISTVGRITVLSSDARITWLNKTTISTTTIYYQIHPQWWNDGPGQWPKGGAVGQNNQQYIDDVYCHIYPRMIVMRSDTRVVQLVLKQPLVQ